MSDTHESARLAWVGNVAVALVGSAYPWLFHRTAALDVGPYGAIVPLQWPRILTVWAVTLLTVFVVALVMWRFSRRRFSETLLAATAVTWGIAFAWRGVVEVAARTSLPGGWVSGGTVAALAVGGWLLFRLTRSREGRFGLGLALAVPMLFVSWQALGFLRLPSATPAEANGVVGAGARATWVLVFDGMPSPRSLDALGWESGSLTGALESQGFEVPVQARSFSTNTYTTIGSMLSLESEPRSGRVPKSDQGPWLAAMAGAHPLAESFAESGHAVITVDNGWSWTRCGAVTTDCRTRPLVSTLEWSMLVNSLAEPFTSVYGPWRTHSLRQLDELERLAAESTGEPRLIYAHLLIPHAPFELDAACQLRVGTTEQTSVEWLRTQKGFLAQMSCAAMRLVALIERIPPGDVVLIVGDHGSDLNESETDFTPAELQDRLSTFVAFRGCDLDPAHLTSNVNAYRGLAECVSSASFPPWVDVASVTCIDAAGEVRLLDARVSLAAGEGMSCGAT